MWYALLLLFLPVLLVGCTPRGAQRSSSADAGESVLPGSRMTIRSAVGVGGTAYMGREKPKAEVRSAFAALCEALAGQQGPRDRFDIEHVTGRFKVLQYLTGERLKGDMLELRYERYPHERAIGEGERFIWFVVRRGKGEQAEYFGYKAVADTPEARRAIDDAVWEVFGCRDAGIADPRIQELFRTAAGKDVKARRLAAADLSIVLQKRNGIWPTASVSFSLRPLLDESAIRLAVKHVASSRQREEHALANMCAHCMGRLVGGAWRRPPTVKPDEVETRVIGLVEQTDDAVVRIILLVGLASSETVWARDTVVAATADPNLGVRKSANYLVEHGTANHFGPAGVIHIASSAQGVDSAGRKIRAIYKWDKTVGAGWGTMVGGLQTRLTVKPAEPKIGEAVRLALDVRNVSDKPIEVAGVAHLWALVSASRDRQRLPPTGFGQGRGPAPTLSALLQPGQQVTLWAMDPGEHFDLTQQGEYRFWWAKIHGNLVAGDGETPPASNPLTFTLTAE